MTAVWIVSALVVGAIVWVTFGLMTAASDEDDYWGEG
jgi:hypothetical protein